MGQALRFTELPAGRGGGERERGEGKEQKFFFQTPKLLSQVHFESFQQGKSLLQ
jgi:hypothetical protein